MIHFSRGMKLAAGLYALAPAPALAAELCLPVIAQTTSARVTAGCSSPVGLCTAGTIKGPWLNGEQRYTAASLGPAPGLPGTRAISILLYAGRIDITTGQGTLAISDTGLYDRTKGVIAEIGHVTAGTGLFDGATGTVYLVGRSNAGGGFDATMSGTICLNP